MRRACTTLVMGLVATLAASCSILLKEEAKQCDADADCRALGFTGSVCDTSQRVCVEIVPQGGNGGAAGNGGAEAGGAGSGGAVSTGGQGGSGGSTPTAGASQGGSAGQGGSVGQGGSMGGGGSAGAGGAAGASGTAGAGGAPPVPCATANCAAAGGTCEDDICVIGCTGPDCIPRCPKGLACKIECGATSCNKGIDCLDARSCDITCLQESCRGEVKCAGDACSVHCNGVNSCGQSPITCDARSCVIDCPANQSCGVLHCTETVESCEFSCKGVQSCGTKLSSEALMTKIRCDATACGGQMGLCCQPNVSCTGAAAPMCN